MKFSAEFVSSFASLASLPNDGLPEIALIGRSNVGKSSLINALAERRNLAKTSSTPGKTRTLNYYKVNGKFYLVDMPGYGYAKQARTERMDWARVAERYFLERKELRAAGLLVDSRHPKLESDELILDWFREHTIPAFIVLTKADKARQQEIAHHVRIIEELQPASKIFITSAPESRGTNELRKFIIETAIERDF